jgi:hypothetical protein
MPAYEVAEVTVTEREFDEQGRVTKETTTVTKPKSIPYNPNATIPYNPNSTGPYYTWPNRPYPQQPGIWYSSHTAPEVDPTYASS